MGSIPEVMAAAERIAAGPKQRAAVAYGSFYCGAYLEAQGLVGSARLYFVLCAFFRQRFTLEDAFGSHSCSLAALACERPMAFLSGGPYLLPFLMQTPITR
jgi:hypothetical protein